MDGLQEFGCMMNVYVTPPLRCLITKLQHYDGNNCDNTPHINNVSTVKAETIRVMESLFNMPAFMTIRTGK